MDSIRQFCQKLFFFLLLFGGFSVDLVAKPPSALLAKQKVAVQGKKNLLKKPVQKKSSHQKKLHSLPIHSIIHEKKVDVGLKNHVILIDPGHGANDEGAKTATSIEKNLCLLTALHLRSLLQSKGYKVEMTRSYDEFVSLEKRVEIANYSNCSLFISLHYNAAKSKEASGIEIFYPKITDPRQDLSKKLAQTILQQMILKTGARSRGVKTGNFHVIRETKVPAILIEGGFMTHPVEGQLLENLSYIQKISEGIADGIERFYLSYSH